MGCLEKKQVTVVGAGLAGSECAYQLAQKGYTVTLYEMRGKTMTPAHKTDLFAELVCSNSLGSKTHYSAPGQLKWEAELKGSLILKAAQKAAVPAGMALGVDRQIFSNEIHQTLLNHPLITVIRDCVQNIESIPRPCVIATGPLTHESMGESLLSHFGGDFLYFYDAIAPIISTDSIHLNLCWKGDRWGHGTGDYINCPLNKDQYDSLVHAIKNAETTETKEFEDISCFEGCMPIESIVSRGHETLRFGPLSPKGLSHPRTGEKFYAIVQLRQENKEATAYNMVGFQTKMTYSEQKRVFRMIPGLENAEFLKLGSLHKNLYIHSPKKLTPQLASKKDSSLFFAGQITGVEGYFESTCIGMIVSGFVADWIEGRPFSMPPRETAFGSLLNALTEEKEHFQPTNMNFSLFPSLDERHFKGKLGKDQKRKKLIERARRPYLKERALN